jgi:hypothetical protein
MKNKPPEKMFVVKKFIKATSAAAAIRKDRSTPPDEIWIDEDWKRGSASALASAMGFTIERDIDRE